MLKQVQHDEIYSDPSTSLSPMSGKQNDKGKDETDRHSQDDKGR